MKPLPFAGLRVQEATSHLVSAGVCAPGETARAAPLALLTAAVRRAFASPLAGDGAGHPELAPGRAFEGGGHAAVTPLPGIWYRVRNTAAAGDRSGEGHTSGWSDGSIWRRDKPSPALSPLSCWRLGRRPLESVWVWGTRCPERAGVLLRGADASPTVVPHGANWLLVTVAWLSLRGGPGR